MIMAHMTYVVVLWIAIVLLEVATVFGSNETSSDSLEWKWPEESEAKTLSIETSTNAQLLQKSSTSLLDDFLLEEEDVVDEDIFSEHEQPTPEVDPQFVMRQQFEKDTSSEATTTSWIDRLKSFFRPSSRNSVLGHAMEAGNQFREKYGGGLPAQQSIYSEGGGGYDSPSSLHRPHPGGMRPDGAFSEVQKPAVKLSLSADFIELNCVAYGRIQQGIRWVKLVGLNPFGHQLFATVADGDRILFDTYHFGVRTDGKHSRLIIRNPDPKSHYGVYQCQVTVAGKSSIIVKEDFVVGKVN